jgi:hypothetical protein
MINLKGEGGEDDMKGENCEEEFEWIGVKRNVKLGIVQGYMKGEDVKRNLKEEDIE